jgi:hypothetical protein
MIPSLGRFNMGGSMTQAINSEVTWEEEVRERIRNWRIQLAGLIEKPDVGKLPELQVLKAAVDVQLALADLMIRSRIADKAKIMAWGSLALPFIGAILGAILGALLKK